MPIVEPSGLGVTSPKIADEALARKFVSQNGSGYLSVNIYINGAFVDPDPDTLQLQVWFTDPTVTTPPSDPRGVLIITAPASEISTEGKGLYYYNIGPQFTQYRGTLYAQWTYQVGGVSYIYDDHMQILDQMPLYDSLSAQERSVVEQVSWMFGDLFDSTEGGPYLIEPFQTHFTYERLAQLESIAVQRFNLIGFPITSYGVGPNGQTPPPNFHGLTVFGTYLEVVRHLRDSYVEIPLFQNMNVTYTDRRDYMQRWQGIFASEEPNYERMVKMAKRSLLSLSQGSLLVHGGLYGPSAGLFINSMYSGQVRSFRFYPAAFAIAFGGLGLR